MLVINVNYTGVTFPFLGVSSYKLQAGLSPEEGHCRFVFLLPNSVVELDPGLE